MATPACLMTRQRVDGDIDKRGYLSQQLTDFHDECDQMRVRRIIKVETASVSY
jgi:hypothetical protein